MINYKSVRIELISYYCIGTLLSLKFVGFRFVPWFVDYNISSSNVLIKTRIFCGCGQYLIFSHLMRTEKEFLLDPEKENHLHNLCPLKEISFSDNLWCIFKISSLRFQFCFPIYVDGHNFLQGLKSEKHIFSNSRLWEDASILSTKNSIFA